MARQTHRSVDASALGEVAYQAYLGAMAEHAPHVAAHSYADLDNDDKAVWDAVGEAVAAAANKERW